ALHESTLHAVGPAAPLPGAPALSVGDRLGSYVVVRKLGEGGMGTVFLAIHEEIRRPVAVKTLHPRVAHDPEIAGRFLHEARAANALQHPGLLGIYEFGKLPDGAPYLVMEYLDGEPLSDRLDRLPVEERIALLPLLRQ